LQMMRFWMRLAGNWIRYKLANQRVDEWNVGLVNKPQQAFLDPEFAPSIEWSAYKEYGQMVADPFLIPAGDSARILVEEFNWSTEKGRISELRGTGTETEITAVIDEGLHMSYPYVFGHDGAIYAIPECGESKSILLYRLDEFTGTWRRDAVLIDHVDAVDATVFQYGGLWWLMHSGSAGCGPWSLYLWHSPSLLGPWKPHVANPVKTDVSNARPAGNLLWHEGCLCRPAQDSRASYGGALCINCIDELSLDAFRETPVCRIAPDSQGPYPHGLHTLSGYGRLTVVDGKRHTWPLGLLLRRLMAKRLRFSRRGFSYSKVWPAGPVALRSGRATPANAAPPKLSPS
ncbi:MAG: glucosamine inositolphosphorylceramide transferase family protein, partial [Terriglobia bacterium]